MPFKERQKEWDQEQDKQLLDGLKGMRTYLSLKEEALDRIFRSTPFGKGYGCVARQTTQWMRNFILNAMHTMPCVY
jgi:hypothetical protein